MALVRVWTDVGARKPVALLAKIEEKDGVILTIRYLSETAKGVWAWEDDTYDIDDDSIAENLKTDVIEDLGYRAFGDEGAYIKCEEDEDYVPETSSDDDEEDEEDDEEDETDDSGSFVESDSEESLGEE
jgi:hypothetical protein